MEIILLIGLLYFNMKLAAEKGQNRWLWAFLTFVGFVVIGGLASSCYVLITYKGPMNPIALQEYMTGLQKDTLTQWLLAIFLLGGGLIMRFILEKMPGRIADDK